jgi:hypothetical protein
MHPLIKNLQDEENSLHEKLEAQCTLMLIPQRLFAWDYRWQLDLAKTPRKAKSRNPEVLEAQHDMAVDR